MAADLTSAPGLEVDFSQPPGAAALIPLDSISWRIFRNPVSLYIGGVAAVLLELAEPRVCSGVWDHTSFRTDPVTRLRRTGTAAMVTAGLDVEAAPLHVYPGDRATPSAGSSAGQGRQR